LANSGVQVGSRPASEGPEVSAPKPAALHPGYAYISDPTGVPGAPLKGYDAEYYKKLMATIPPSTPLTTYDAEYYKKLLATIPPSPGSTTFDVSKLVKFDMCKADPSDPPHGMYGRWATFAKIGRSAKTIVYLGWDGKAFGAVKLVAKGNPPNEGMTKGFYRETDTLNMLKGKPHVLQILDQYNDHPTYWIVVTEVMDAGDLYHYKKKKGGLPVDEAKRLFKEILKGVHALYDIGRAHIDIKSLNIFLKSHTGGKVVAYLSDFETSKRLGKPTKLTGNTPLWTPPEAGAKDALIDPEKMDVFALGGVLYEMFDISDKWRGPKPNLFPPVSVNKDIFDKLPENLKFLIQGAMATDPAKRWTMKQLSASPWLADA